MRISLFNAFCLLTLLSTVCNVTVDFRVRKIDSLSANYHFSTQSTRYSATIDCLVKSVPETQIIGIQYSARCKFLSSYQSNNNHFETSGNMRTITIIQKIDKEVCPFQPIATFYHPINNLKSVYFVTKTAVPFSQRSSACFKNNLGQPVIITSKTEMDLLLKIQQNIGKPLLTAATRFNLYPWLWYYGRYQVPHWLTDNSIPHWIGSSYHYGIINRKAQLVSVTSADGPMRVMCECYDFHDK